MAINSTERKSNYVDNTDKNLPDSSSYLVASFGNTKPSVMADIQLDDAEDIEDDRLGILQEAELLIEQINEDILSVGRLTASQKKAIFYYLSIFSALVSRIIDLHTKLPLATFRLQKPKHNVDIVQDYIFDYFNKLVNSAKFKVELRNIIRNRWVFGVGLARIDDDFCFLKDTLIDDDLSNITRPEISQEDLDKIYEINGRYNLDPESISWAEKLEVLKHYILNINPKYQGIKSFRSISPLDVSMTKVNRDIDYNIYSIPRSKPLTDFMNSYNSSDDKDLQQTLEDLGYSKATIHLHTDSEATTSTIDIDSDPFNDDGAYILSLDAGQDVLMLEDSILNRILEPAIRNLIATHMSNQLVSLSTKVDRIISAPNASKAQLDMLQQDLQAMAQADQGSLLAVNFEVNVDEISLDMKQNADLDNVIDRTNKEITTALGIPEDIISGDGGSYGGSFLKVELMSNEYAEFRDALKVFIEEKIFRPIAIKKGFISVDAWGEAIPVYPNVRFDKFSIARNSEDMQFIKDLVSDGMLPRRTLMEILGFNSEDIAQTLQREQGSFLNSKVQETVNDAISNLLSERLETDAEFKKRILDALGFNSDDSNNQPKQQTEEDDNETL